MNNNLLVDIEVTLPSSELLRFELLRNITKDTRSLAEIFLDCAYKERDKRIAFEETKESYTES